MSKGGNNPTGKGGFQKGHERLGGRKKIPDDVKEMLKAAAPDAVRGLIDLAMNSENEKIRLDAGREILDRVYGKPQQSVDMKTEVSAPVSITFEGDLNEWSK